MTAGTAGIEVVLVMGTNPNSNLGLSQLFKVLELADEAPVWNKFELVSVVWVVDLVVTINRGPGRPPWGLTARPPGPPAFLILLPVLLIGFLVFVNKFLVI